jgi:hypothetical protein
MPHTQLLPTIAILQTSMLPDFNAPSRSKAPRKGPNGGKQTRSYLIGSFDDGK